MIVLWFAFCFIALYLSIGVGYIIGWYRDKEADVKAQSIWDYILIGLAWLPAEILNAIAYFRNKQ
jgi:hypothetical protein